jgi:hypothetical protein
LRDNKADAASLLGGVAAKRGEGGGFSEGESHAGEAWRGDVVAEIVSVARSFVFRRSLALHPKEVAIP